MKQVWPGRLALLVCLSLAGCSANVPEIEPGARPEEPEPRLGTKIDFDVANWLALPRPQLAKLAEEWAETVAKQREIMRNRPLSLELLPHGLPPFTVPGLNQATFSVEAGFSLPSYATAGKADPGLALHLARFGDRAAAGQLVAKSDEATRKRLAAMPSAKNYPIEWTRLVSLVLISSHLKMAMADVDGATQLVLVHKQLQTTLDARATAGPLGSALLPWGKKALVAAAAAWRGPERKKKNLAEDIDGALAAWGDIPAPTPALLPGATKEDVLTVLGGTVRGKAVFCISAPAVARAMDFLTLPLSNEGVQSVVAFLDEDDRFVELQIALRAKIDTFYPAPEDVAYGLLERGYAAGDLKVGGLQRQAFTRPGLRFDVIRSGRSLAVGGLVRITAEKPGKPAASRSLKEFGEVQLDRAFESQRRKIARQQSGPTVTVKDVAMLKRLAGPLELPAPTSAVLSRFAPPSPLIAAYELNWSADDNALALERLLPSLWAAFGPGDITDVNEDRGGYFAFTWHDEAHCVQLRLPYDDRGPLLEARNIVPADGMAGRIKEVLANEKRDREARLAAGKPDERLVRSPGIANERSFAGLKLGQNKDTALAMLPWGKSYLHVPEEHGVRVVCLTTPSSTATYWLRQLQVRFDANDKLAEIRLRYEPGPAPSKKGQTLRDYLSDTRAGAPETLPPLWEGLWSDAPPAGKMLTQRWQDDRMVRVYHEDANGMELILRDRSAEDEVAPRQWLPTGVGKFRLGASRAEIESKGRNPLLSNSDGASVYRAPKDSPFEMVLVWFTPVDKKERATRIVAVHRERPSMDAKEVAVTLNRLWGKEIKQLGFVRRQLPANGSMLGAYFWHDDKIRIKTWAENTDNGPRLMTEWRNWPVEVGEK